jgi:lipoprotein-anchoring transpeptidase ErfK/SrfK
MVRLGDRGTLRLVDPSPPISVKSFATIARKRQARSWSIPTHGTFTTCFPKARRHGAIVGEDAQSWSGVVTVGRKEEWPGWTPTENEKRRLGPLPNYVEGGASNPMGARALYLYSGGQDTLYRIHGTNQPGWIGHAISSGCIRLTNEDVIDLYRRVQMGAVVVVLGPKRGGSRTTSASAQ